MNGVPHVAVELPLCFTVVLWPGGFAAAKLPAFPKQPALVQADPETAFAADDIHLDVTMEAKRWLAEKGYDKSFGARPLKRALQKHLEDVLSDEMLKGRFKNGGVIEVSLQDDALVFTEKSSALNAC